MLEVEVADGCINVRGCEDPPSESAAALVEELGWDDDVIVDRRLLGLRLSCC